MAINEAGDGLDEGPTKNGVDGDIGAEGDAELDGAAVVECVGEVAGDDGFQDTAQGRQVLGLGFGDGAEKLAGLKRVEVVVSFDERCDEVGVLGGEVLVEGAGTAVEAGASVEEGGEGCVGFIGVGGTELEGDGGWVG